MARLATYLVKHPTKEGEVYGINAIDYNPNKHVLIEPPEGATDDWVCVEDRSGVHWVHKLDFNPNRHTRFVDKEKAKAPPANEPEPPAEKQAAEATPPAVEKVAEDAQAEQPRKRGRPRTKPKPETVPSD